MASTSNLGVQSLAEIAEYRNDVVDALTFYFKLPNHRFDPRFLGYTPYEFNHFLIDRIQETDLQTSLAILAALEAALRIDYQLRVKQRYKDPLSRKFRAIYKKKQERTRFEEDLLAHWVEEYPSLKHLIRELQAALHFRHWLAHGRYWKRPAHGRFDYLSLYSLAEAILIQLPLYRNT